MLPQFIYYTYSHTSCLLTWWLETPFCKMPTNFACLVSAEPLRQVLLLCPGWANTGGSREQSHNSTAQPRGSEPGEKLLWFRQCSNCHISWAHRHRSPAVLQGQQARISFSAAGTDSKRNLTVQGAPCWPAAVLLPQMLLTSTEEPRARFSAGSMGRVLEPVGSFNSKSTKFYLQLNKCFFC